MRKICQNLLTDSDDTFNVECLSDRNKSVSFRRSGFIVNFETYPQRSYFTCNNDLLELAAYTTSNFLPRLRVRLTLLLAAGAVGSDIQQVTLLGLLRSVKCDAG